MGEELKKGRNKRKEREREEREEFKGRRDKRRIKGGVGSRVRGKEEEGEGSWWSKNNLVEYGRVVK